jgi:hypothetical protein
VHARGDAGTVELDPKSDPVRARAYPTVPKRSPQGRAVRGAQCRGWRGPLRPSVLGELLSLSRTLTPSPCPSPPIARPHPQGWKKERRFEGGGREISLASCRSRKVRCSRFPVPPMLLFGDPNSLPWVLSRGDPGSL